MREYMTFLEFQDAITWMEHDYGEDEYGNALTLQLPYRLFPGSYPGGIYPLITRVRWESYGWNPPGYMPDLTESQANVSGKPTWEMVVNAVEPGWLLRNKPTVVAAFKRECEQRINAGYGADNTDDEMFKRLRGDTSGDAERERLRTRYHAVKAWVEAATTKTVLQDVDASADEWWALSWTPPTK